MDNMVSQTVISKFYSGASGRVLELEHSSDIPWYVWCLAAAATAEIFGNYWDISWHISIGRDSFWTPPHAMVYLAGILAGIASGYTILTATFGSSQTRRNSVSIWRFCGPLGSFVASWGCFMMITSAPFDNWWHAAYGLDVKIISPPHTMLVLGEAMIDCGAVLFICAQLNRAYGLLRQKLDLMLLFLGGILTSGLATFILEFTPMEFMHNSQFYLVVALAFPTILVAISHVSKFGCAATVIAATYTTIFLVGLWILPLFPAQPRLSPVYQHVTRMVPLWFPLMLIAPAIALDVLRQLMKERWGGLRSCFAAGCVFLPAFVAIQWPFADFLISSAARNRVFGTIYFSFFDQANLLYNPYHFYNQDKTRGIFLEGMIVALLISIASSSIGMAFGEWLRKVQR